jgi:hypothetical protein
VNTKLIIGAGVLVDLARARVKIWLVNLAYNMRRFIWLKAKYASE